MQWRLLTRRRPQSFTIVLIRFGVPYGCFFAVAGVGAVRG